jgi:hypothetical protein
VGRYFKLGLLKRFKDCTVEAIKLTKEHQLIRSAKRGDVNGVKKMLNEGADVNFQKGKGRWIRKETPGLVIKIWESGGRTPLYWAADNGHFEVVKLLVERGADVNLGDEFAETPLHRAVDNEHVQIAGFLLENGAYVNAICNISYKFTKEIVGWYKYTPNYFVVNPLAYVTGRRLISKTEYNKKKRKELIKLLKKYGGVEKI